MMQVKSHFIKGGSLCIFPLSALTGTAHIIRLMKKAAIGIFSMGRILQAHLAWFKGTNANIATNYFPTKPSRLIIMQKKSSHSNL
jgi:hypothetical protein